MNRCATRATAALAALCAAATSALAAPPVPPVAAPAVPDAATHFTLWSLFRQSADLFTILLLIGSLAASAIIVRCFMQVRERNIAPPDTEQMIRRLIAAKRFGELKRFVDEEESLVGRTLRAAMRQPGDDRDQVRSAAEMTASEECSRWFRSIEPLQLIGNLGPLLGLAGTVWGMIIAFASLGATQGRAGPADLSLGISKALFHTLLGLLLAVPALVAFGHFRSKIDRLCTRALAVAAELVELLPTRHSERNAEIFVPEMQPETRSV